MSVEEAEADYFSEVGKDLASETNEARARMLQKPFGFQNEKWEALKAQMRTGDELWEFCASRSAWNALMGVAGYELVRDGVVIAQVISSRN